MIIILLSGILIGTQFNKIFLDKEILESSQKIGEVLNLTHKYHIDDVSTEELVEEAIKGMFSRLDPHTIYLPAVDNEISEDEFRGNFEGIGVEFQIIKDTIVVVSAISGGPSEALGILAGDKIIRIDGKDCIGFTNNKVIKSLRGSKGSIVDVEIFRPSNGNILKFSIQRDKIPLYSVDVSLIFGSDIGYISLSRFSETTTRELLEALDKLKKAGMEKIILDLRNNPGGLLSQAYNIADIFIDDHKLIVYTEGKKPEFNEEYFAEEDYEYQNYPLVILINKGSASASEIVAGAVQDWDRGYLVGETSFGKGLVQRPFLLSDNSAVRITVSKYYTPIGRMIQRDYGNGSEEYYRELMDRSDIDSVQGDSSQFLFKSKGGRQIISKGGITPDFKITHEYLTDYSVELSRGNVYYLFVRNYIDKEIEMDIMHEFPERELFIHGYKIDDRLTRRFVSFAESQGVKYRSDQFEKDNNYIQTRLKAFIAREYWKNEGWFNVLLLNDEQFLKAINLAESLNSNSVSN